MIGTAHGPSHRLSLRGLRSPINPLPCLQAARKWGRPVGSPASTAPSFAFMECFDYPFYATLDVRFYGSMPLVKFWPDLDKQELRQFSDTVSQDLTQKYLWIWKTQQTKSLEFRMRKAKGAVPHDLGVPQEDPFKLPNAFSWQNT